MAFLQELFSSSIQYILMLAIAVGHFVWEPLSVRIRRKNKKKGKLESIRSERLSSLPFLFGKRICDFFNTMVRKCCIQK